MLSENLVATITLKSMTAIAGLLLFAGLISKVQQPATLPTTEVMPSPIATIR
jgi:hypothetical protein